MVAARSISIPREFQSVTDVVAGLIALEAEFIASEDRRGIFVSAYVVISKTCDEWIRQGRFLNNELVARYVVEFANAYHQALTHYEGQERVAVPTAWQQAFDTAARCSASVSQHLLLGINAHINYDLPYAALRAGLNVHCDRCYRDHVRINDALRMATPLVRQRIAANHRRSMHITNWIYGRSIDKAVADSFGRARDHGWAMAQALASAKGNSERVRVGQLIDARAALAGRMILRNKYAPAKCIATLHEVERFLQSPRHASGLTDQMVGVRSKEEFGPRQTHTALYAAN